MSHRTRLSGVSSTGMFYSENQKEAICQEIQEVIGTAGWSRMAKTAGCTPETAKRIWRRHFSAGDYVKVIAGPLAGQKARVVRAAHGSEETIKIKFRIPTRSRNNTHSIDGIKLKKTARFRIPR